MTKQINDLLCKYLFDSVKGSTAVNMSADMNGNDLRQCKRKKRT